MIDIKLVRATLKDLDAVRAIARDTFIETFAAIITETDMQQYLAQNLSAERVAAEMSNPDSLFFLARAADAVIGYLKLNVGRAQTELQEADSVEIERIYVKRAYHGQQVGPLLYNQAVATARGLGKTSIWLGVWEKNARAIRFYEKQGFTAFGTHLFRLGTDEQTDVLMRRPLLPAPHQAAAGTDKND